MLMATVVLSFFAALGLALLVFELFADFPGEDPSYPLFAFIFLVALGIDYNIFLMARVREEAQSMPTKEAMLKGLAVTGGVITSAGIVLAGTFSVLAVLPLVALTQIGITVALGVLLDTFVVRSILVPALTFSLDEKTWWPSALGSAMIGSVWGLLLVGLVLASSVMALLWCVQVRIRDASHVDVAWAVAHRLRAILYALLADGDVGHRVLAARARLASGDSASAATSYFNRVLGKEEDGRYQALRAKWGAEREPELLRLLPVPGGLRRLLLAAVRVHRARPADSGSRRPRLDRRSPSGRSGTSGRSSPTASSPSGARTRRTRARPRAAACGAGRATRTTSSSG